MDLRTSPNPTPLLLDTTFFARVILDLLKALEDKKKNELRLFLFLLRSGITIKEL